MPKKTKREFAVDVLEQEIRIRRDVVRINFAQITSLEDCVKIIKNNIADQKL